MIEHQIKEEGGSAGRSAGRTEEEVAILFSNQKKK